MQYCEAKRYKLEANGKRMPRPPRILYNRVRDVSQYQHSTTDSEKARQDVARSTLNASTFREHTSDEVHNQSKIERRAQEIAEDQTGED